MRLLPLLRVLRVTIPILRNADEHARSSVGIFGLNPGVTRVLKLMLFLVYTCHWIGCMWWCVGEIEQDSLVVISSNLSTRFEDPSGSTWGPSPWLRETQPAANQFAHALLWGASMMTGFVPFDVMPNTLLEVTVTIIALFFGLIVNTVIISSTTSALQSISFKSSRVVNKMENIAQYMRHKHVPIPLARKITAFFEYQLSPHRSGAGGQHDLGELPPVLAMELIMHTHQDLFRECPIFHLIPPPTALSLVERFEAVVYIPDEIVIHEGAPNAALYVINRGLVTVWKHDVTKTPIIKKTLTTLTDNDFFGEQTLLKTITSRKAEQAPPRTPVAAVQANATCQCASYCDMFRLTSNDFMAVLDQARSRRSSWVGKDVSTVLANAANERNSRAERLRKRSLMWAAAAQEKIRQAERSPAGIGSRIIRRASNGNLRAIVADSRSRSRSRSRDSSRERDTAVKSAETGSCETSEDARESVTPSSQEYNA